MSSRPKNRTTVGDAVDLFVSTPETDFTAPKPAAKTGKRGRPKKAKTVSKGVSVYFTAEEKAALEAEAEKVGLSVASFVRVQIKKDLGI